MTLEQAKKLWVFLRILTLARMSERGQDVETAFRILFPIESRKDDPMWSSLFTAIAEAFKTLRAALTRSSSSASSDTTIDAEKARAGTAAGAAAEHAGHTAGPSRKPPQ